MNIQKAVAHIKGSREYPTLHGTVFFKQTRKGVLVTAEIYGLSDNNEYNTGDFAFHILQFHPRLKFFHSIISENSLYVYEKCNH